MRQWAAAALTAAHVHRAHAHPAMPAQLWCPQLHLASHHAYHHAHCAHALTRGQYGLANFEAPAPCLAAGQWAQVQATGLALANALMLAAVAAQ